MIKLELTLDNIDYDRFFNKYFTQAKDYFAGSDEPAAKLISSVPENIARTVWNGLTLNQKEKIVASIFNSQAKRFSLKGESVLRQQGFEARVVNLRATAVKNQNK